MIRLHLIRHRGHMPPRVYERPTVVQLPDEALTAVRFLRDGSVGSVKACEVEASEHFVERDGVTWRVVKVERR